MKYLWMVIFLSLPVTAHAAWVDDGMHPGMAPHIGSNQVQAIHHEDRTNALPVARAQAERHVQSTQPVHQNQPTPKPQIVRHDQQRQPVRHDQPVVHHVVQKQHRAVMPDYFRRDINYYRHDDVIFPYQDVNPPFIVPNGFELVMVNGETFYYNQGTFYQEVGGQLVVIPAVLGAVVDYIPQDYQIVMADGVHYLFIGGVYYQRVDQGFEVVQPPGIDQE